MNMQAFICLSRVFRSSIVRKAVYWLTIWHAINKREECIIETIKMHRKNVRHEVTKFL